MDQFIDLAQHIDFEKLPLESALRDYLDIVNVLYSLIYGTINFKKCTAVQKINFIYQISQVINVTLIPPPFLIKNQNKMKQTLSFLCFNTL